MIGAEALDMFKGPKNGSPVRMSKGDPILSQKTLGAWTTGRPFHRFVSVESALCDTYGVKCYKYKY